MLSKVTRIRNFGKLVNTRTRALQESCPLIYGSLSDSQIKEIFLSLSLFFFFFWFLGPHPLHMEVPRPGVDSGPPLPASTTATAMRDPSHICDLRHSSRQHRILDPLTEARDTATLAWILVGVVNH